MQDDKIRQAIEESLKPQSEVNKIIVAIIAALIPITLTAAGRLAYDIALLLVITILVVYLGWIFGSRNKSTIDWGHFYNVMVRVKSGLDWGDSLVKDAESLTKGKDHHKLGGHLADISYNNYILCLYLIALYESDKEKFAKELWDKARISNKSDEGSKQNHREN